MIPIPSARLSINASPQNVFRVLKDFNHYHQWNPCININGNAVVGEHIHIKPRRTMFWTSLNYQVTKILDGDIIEWKEVSPLGFIIHTRREHFIYTKSDGSSIYSTKLYFSGFLGPVAKYFYGKYVYKGLKEEATALKQFCESIYPLTWLD